MAHEVTKTYQPNTKQTRKLYEKNLKDWLSLYGNWTK